MVSSLVSPRACRRNHVRRKDTTSCLLHSRSQNHQPTVSHPRIDQSRLTSRALFERPAIQRLVLVEDRTEHRAPLLSSLVGRARATKSQRLTSTPLLNTHVYPAEREREREEKFATGHPANSTQRRRSFRNERRPVVVAARRGERTTLRMTIRALHHLETTFRRYRHHRRHLHHHHSSTSTRSSQPPPLPSPTPTRVLHVCVIHRILPIPSRLESCPTTTTDLEPASFERSNINTLISTLMFCIPIPTPLPIPLSPRARVNGVTR